MLLVWAAGLTFLAGLFAMTDSALSRVSQARAAEMAREGVRGAGALQAVATDVVRHLNLLLLLRLACELSATTLVAVFTIGQWGVHRLWLAGMVTAGSMTVVSFVAVGVAPRTIGRQHAYTVGRYAAPFVLLVSSAKVVATSYPWASQKSKKRRFCRPMVSPLADAFSRK